MKQEWLGRHKSPSEMVLANCSAARPESRARDKKIILPMVRSQSHIGFLLPVSVSDRVKESKNRLHMEAIKRAQCPAVHDRGSAPLLANTCETQRNAMGTVGPISLLNTWQQIHGTEHSTTHLQVTANTNGSMAQSFLQKIYSQPMGKTTQEAQPPACSYYMST